MSDARQQQNDHEHQQWDEQMSEAPKVYAAISSVMEKLAKAGIGKTRKNEQQGYKFRGIDDVYNALSPFLAEARLVILPHFSEREVVERLSASNKALFYVTLKGEFELVCTEDGSHHNAGPFYGEAMDSADKATNKAMSAAFKYMAMEVFCIPTEGDNDADSTTHDVAPSDALRPTTPQELTDALMLLAEEAPNGMGAVQATMDKLRKPVQDALRKDRKTELASIKTTATAKKAQEHAAAGA
jgi:hypothetical protein